MRRGPRCPVCGWRVDAFRLAKSPETWVAGCPLCMTYMRGRTLDEAYGTFVEYCEMSGRTRRLKR